MLKQLEFLDFDDSFLSINNEVFI